jgi:hypothetical protein
LNELTPFHTRQDVELPRPCCDSGAFVVDDGTLSGREHRDARDSFESTLMRTTKAMAGGGLTAVENLAINMVYRALRESRYNRTACEYAAIAERLPPLKVLHHQVNEALQTYLSSLAERPEFCRWESGHQRRVYETYPDEISQETLRRALVLHGFRVPRRRTA